MIWVLASQRTQASRDSGAYAHQSELASLDQRDGESDDVCRSSSGAVVGRVGDGSRGVNRAQGSRGSGV